MRAAAAILYWIAALTGAAAQASEIASARYEGPTERYPHAVLGDAIEHDTLLVELSDGTRQSARWPAPIVFEDTEPRLADLDGDGAPEVIVVESHDQRGGRLAVWGLRDGRLQQIAATPFIGTRFRWLAPVGAADLDGDGAVEIAYVDRPHLVKRLLVWRFRDDALEQVASLDGVTNHRIGERDIAGGIRDCGDGPEIIAASADWRSVVAVRMTGSGLAARTLGPHRDRASFRQALDCR